MLWLLLAALADEPADPPVVDIYASEEAAFADLSRALRALGFRAPVYRKDEVVFHNVTTWRPSLHLHDDGRVEARRGPIRLGLPGQGPWGTGGNSVCLGIPTNTQSADENLQFGPVKVKPSVLPGACLHLDALLVSNRREHNEEARILGSIGELAHQWSEAVATRAWQDRLARAVPDEVRGLWDDAPDEVSGKAALVDHWCSRLDNDAGQAVRAIVEDLLNDVVQASDHPLSAAEIDAASARCGRELHVDPR
ncbi:MAG TPA: hypothetical protein PKA64_26780 [Myxococcota bacterium]|nr:hypothetical protein [Myxococcota bacterium]